MNVKFLSFLTVLASTSAWAVGPTPFTLTADVVTATTTLNAPSSFTLGIDKITGFGTGVATALALNVGSVGAPVLFNGALGTPSSGSIATTLLTGTITNAQLAGSIAYSKLSLTGAILNADLAGSIDLTTKVTGALPQANIAALTGDVTKPSGSGVTSLANIPALSGANLTTLNATNISSGTLADARNTVSNSTTTTMANLTTVGALAAGTFTTSWKSTTALATPSALSATQSTNFASTVSGSALMGFGTTNDVTLMNRAGTVCLGVGPNTTAINIPGTLAVTGTITGSSHVVAGTNSAIYWTSRSEFLSLADGRISASNNAGSTLTRFTFGAETTSCPALQISGTGITFGLGDGTAGGSVTASGTLAVTGNTTLGTGTAIKNVRHGVSGAMTAGAVTVTDTGATANTRYSFSAHTLGTITIPGGYYASTRTASTSFVITSSQVTETSTIDWLAVEP